MSRHEEQFAIGERGAIGSKLVQPAMMVGHILRILPVLLSSSIEDEFSLRI